ncbi:MAG: aminotransferase class I/II-fold pyridoxal phosphate-dependent enzyme [Acidimicrobiales bacterium]
MTAPDNGWVFLSPPDVTDADREGLLQAFDGGWIAPAGPSIDAFEASVREYTGAEAAVGLSSGTAALQLGLILAGVKHGDEVVVQTATFAASAFAVLHVGAHPVFCDVGPDTWNLDPDRLDGFLAERAAVDRLPAAVMPVDLYGNLPDYVRMLEVCARYGVAVVEDSAESLGSVGPDGRKAGTFGDLGVFSFNGNKIITTSGGGMLIGPAEQIARARHLASQARENEIHYEHLDVGFNFRMSNLLAGLGLAQFGRLEEKIARREAIFRRYQESFPDLDWMPDGVTTRPNRWLSVALLPAGFSPTTVCRRLQDQKIEARPVWKPMHQQPVFNGVETIGGGVADYLFRYGICLPSGSGMTDDQQDRVIDALTAIVRAPAETRVA